MATTTRRCGDTGVIMDEIMEILRDGGSSGCGMRTTAGSLSFNDPLTSRGPGSERRIDK